jgi:hypothetical protein
MGSTATKMHLRIGWALVESEGESDAESEIEEPPARAKRAPLAPSNGPALVRTRPVLSAPESNGSTRLVTQGLRNR